MTDYAYPVGSAVQVTGLGSCEGELDLPEGTRGVVLEIIENDEGLDQAEVNFGGYGVHVTYDDQVALAEGSPMSGVKVGDKVRLTGSLWPNYGLQSGDIVTVERIENGIIFGDRGSESLGNVSKGLYDGGYGCELVETVDLSAAALKRLAENLSVALTEVAVNVPVETALRSVLDATDPNHYKFPGGAEVRHISEWLTANAAQALQYIARSSRIDGQNKGDAREDLLKARKFIDFELERLDV